MSATHEALVGAFVDYLSKPAEQLVPALFGDKKKRSFGTEKLRHVCKALFGEVERLHKLRTESEASLSGLDELYLGSEEQPVDAETLWGQIELQNGALKPLLRKSVKRLSRDAGANSSSICLLDMNTIDDESASDIEKVNEEDSAVDEENENDDDGEEGDDEIARRMKERMERAMAEMDEESEGEEDARERPIGKQDDEAQLMDPSAEELNDGFFDLHEMEAFADEEEDYLPEDAFGESDPETDNDDEDRPKKKSFHQKQRDGEMDSGSDDDSEDGGFELSKVRRRKYRPDDEVDALFSLYETPKENDDDSVVNMTAADFFGKPNMKSLTKFKKRQPKESIDDAEADSWDDASFGDGGEGWRDEGDSEEDDVGVDKEDQGDQEPQQPSSQGKPTHTSDKSKANKLLKQTEELEKDMLAEKPWHMTGETGGSARPVNSLLDATPEFEIATKRAPIITVEHTENLEEIIKRRILNEDWDDVIPRELPDVAWNKKRGELPEVSQEKSKLSLGALYEREYLKKAVGYDAEAAEKQTEEEKAKSEMKALFARLCSKLDSLSNYHFTPRPVAPETEITTATTPAIAMEEVLPLHVSNARGVAPEEVYEAKKGRDAVVRGESELSQVCSRLACTERWF